MEKNLSVWDKEVGEIRKPGLSHVVMTALFSGVGIVVGTIGSLAVPVGFVSAFWPGQAIQSVGSIWYGAWGGIAGVLFPIISNVIGAGVAIPVSLAYIPGNFLQSMIAGIAFRTLKRDPRLKSFKDWIVYIIFGILISNAVGAFWGTWTQRLFGLLTPDSHFVTFMGWWIGNSVGSGILGIVMLKFISPIVIKSKTFCKGYWA
ncbi:hypothetical protein [Miniphocaeibacter halophilus]|uniref:Uncharacterized protein n=1 Tax=Miniphocaeibacter halophilus TaxID=2931922 RepID=A0AC61MMR4_9FIRM|nr:hypothetical protein [Miniphocaeibacter halophilus]QQK06957.1 hypothetical protein JFY71_06305 [Miniphocaeibacter halophilus]